MGAVASTPSVIGCEAASARAIRQDVTLTTLPRACRGLPPAKLKHAAAIAIREVTGHFPKARRRHLAARASVKIDYLFKVAAREAARNSPGPHRTPVAASSPNPLVIPARAVTLATWLLTVAAGSYLLFGSLLRGRRREHHAGGGPRRRLTVAYFHAGLAVTGLLIWTAFVASGWTPVAWIAVGVLTVVLGLGMATLFASIAATADAPATAEVPASTDVPHARRTPVLMIAVHGTLASLTILLALLAAIAAR